MGMLKDLAKKGYLGEKTKSAAESGKGIWKEDNEREQEKRKHECEEGMCAHNETLRRKPNGDNGSR